MNLEPERPPAQTNPNLNREPEPGTPNPEPGTRNPEPKLSAARASALVAAGILLSRLAGLVRVSVFAHYFGQRSDAADAFNAAFRIPNLLQNLFGEGALSASFIPVYAGLLARGEQDEADRVARSVFIILSLVTSILVLAGVVLAPGFIGVIAPGFSGSKRELTTTLVRILFPGAGLLVISAWCLGVLNSHRKFFISYTAPVIWNAAMITTLVVFGGGRPLDRLAVILAIGSVAGSGLQFAVQLPSVLGVFGHAARGGSPFTLTPAVRSVVREFRPRLRQPRRRPGQRVYRHPPGQPPADRRRDGVDECAGALHAAGQPFRYLGLGRRIAGDVRRRR